MPCSPFLLCKRHTNLVCPFSQQSKRIIPVNHNLKFSRHSTVYRNYYVFVHTCSCSFGGLLGHISNNTLIKKEVNLFIVVNCICTFHTNIHCNSIQPTITITIPLTFPNGWSAFCMVTNKKINF